MMPENGNACMIATWILSFSKGACLLGQNGGSGWLTCIIFGRWAGHGLGIKLSACSIGLTPDLKAFYGGKHCRHVIS
jgi:hypothetical protein